MGVLASGIKWLTLETAVSRVLQLISAFYVARILGPEVMGTVALVLISLELFRLVSQLGITQALIHHKDPTRNQLATLYTLNWGLAAAGYSVIYITSPYIALFFEEPNLAELLPVTGLILFTGAVGQQTLALLQKKLRFKAIAIVSIVGAVTNVAAAITLVTMGWGIWSVIIGQITGDFVRSFLALVFGISQKLFSGFGVSFGQIKPMVSYGLYQTGAMFMNMVNSRADQLVIGKVIGASALGLYSLGSQVTLQAMQQINGIATRVVFPAISLNQDDITEVKRIYLAMIANVLIVSAPLFIGLAILSPMFVDVVLGDKWHGLSSVLSILCGYVLVRSLGNLNGPLVLGLGKAKWAFYWNLLLLFLIPVIVFVSSLTKNIEVVASVLLATQLVLVVVAYFYWVRRLLGPCAKEYLITIMKPVLSASVMGGGLAVIYLGNEWPSNLTNLLLLVALGTVMYLVAALMFNRKNTISFFKMLFPNL